MKIVVLDGYTLNPGDLDWSPLKHIGDLTVYDRTPQNEVVPRALDADVIFTNKTPLTQAQLEQMPALKYIGVLATGYNVVDVAAARTRGIVVCNVPGYGTPSVVQLTFALLLELTLHVQRHSDAVMDGRWAASKDFSFWDYPLVELQGKQMGIIGFGDIGRKVADVATAFGMQVLAHSRTQTTPLHSPHTRWCKLPELLQQSDVVSIHCPLTPATNQLINAATLQLMKPSAFLLNTARGPIINDNDVANALNNGTIAGAGLDVLTTEPPAADNPLFKAKNCIITPHIAWATLQARQRLMDVTVSNLQSFLAGKPVNVVNQQ